MSQFILSPKPFKLPSALDVLVNPDKGFYFFDDFITDTTKNYALVTSVVSLNGNFKWDVEIPIELISLDQKFNGVALFESNQSIIVNNGFAIQKYLMGYPRNKNYTFDYQMRFMFLESGNPLRLKLGSHVIAIQNNQYLINNELPFKPISNNLFNVFRCIGQTNGNVRYYLNGIFVEEKIYLNPNPNPIYPLEGDVYFNIDNSNSLRKIFIDWIKLEAQYI